MNEEFDEEDEEESDKEEVEDDGEDFFVFIFIVFDGDGVEGVDDGGNGVVPDVNDGETDGTDDDGFEDGFWVFLGKSCIIHLFNK